MATKQELYDEALIEIGDRTYGTAESKEAIRTLDKIYDSVVRECLSEASWNFAIDFQKLDGDTGLISYAADTGTLGTGYQLGFTKPSGWYRTFGLSSDDRFQFPEIDYQDFGDTIRADNSPLYIMYGDTGRSMGTTGLATWTPLFKRYVVLELATRIITRLTQASRDEKEQVKMDRDKARRRAKNQDAMDEPGTKFAPQGRWTQARYGRSSNRDRGSNTKLTG